MANFHENNLVIAADEENMRKVLTRIAENLAANSEETGFSLDQIEGKTTAAKLYSVVERYIDAYYWCAFAGAPIDQEVLDAESEEWGANEYHRSHLNTIAAALGNVAAKLSDAGGPSVGVSFAPIARPMSETACVHLSSCGNNYVLKIDYATAWEPNSKDIDSFFMGLPSGDYGVAFYDSDDYDQYKTINAFAGLHHGRAGLRLVETKVVDESFSNTQLRNLANDIIYNLPSGISDIALLANNIAIREWSCLDWADDDDDYDDGYGFEDSDSTSSRFRNDYHVINWNNPDDSDFSKIDELIITTMKRFPWTAYISDAGYEGCETSFETLIPGDVVKLVSDWDTKYFDPVGIAAYASGDRRVGWLDSYLYFGDQDRTALACILPHVRAHAEFARPILSKCVGGMCFMAPIRLEISDEPLEHILDEVHALLKKQTGERELVSHYEEAM